MSSQSSSETEVQHSVSKKSTVTCVTSRINAATERCVVMSVLGLDVTFPQIFVERVVCMRQGSVVTEPSAVKFASSQQVGNVEVSLVQGFVNNSLSLCFGCGSEQGGPATCSGACECSDSCWIIMTRQQSLSTPSMPVGTETVEPVRGKKVLKKHLQRSSDKLVEICSAQLIPVSLSSWCLMDFSTSVSSVYCLLWVRAQRDYCTDYQS